MELSSRIALKSGQRHKLLIFQFPSSDDAREIKSVCLRPTLALHLLLANFGYNYNRKNAYRRIQLRKTFLGGDGKCGLKHKWLGYMKLYA